MIRRQQITTKTGEKRTYISVLEGYRPGDGTGVKQRTVKNFGCLEDQPDKEKFLKEIEEFQIAYFKSKEKINIILDQVGEKGTQVYYNYGHIYLDAIYKFLELDKFFKQIKTKATYDVEKIFKFLVFNRILNPDSKRATFQLSESFYGFDCDFGLHQIYRSLDLIYQSMNEMQVHLNEVIKRKIGRETSFAYYDVTNYFSEIDFPKSDEDLRQRGVSKEHRVDPIVQLGLFMDNNNLPISMTLFKGNTSDSLTLQPAMKKIKDHYGLKRLIVVADKGMNSNRNLVTIAKNNDGYVVSQILKGLKGKRYFDKLSEENEFIYNKNRTYKYRLFEEDYPLTTEDGQVIQHKRKVLIYWKKSIAEREAKKREIKIKKAEKSILNGTYDITKAAQQYININHIVKRTGEIATGLEYYIDQNKIEQAEKYDGYFCIVTSERNYTQKEIHEIYSGLGKIEESFRITKTSLEARPMYVSTNNHIQAHFQICFVALLMLRLIEMKLKTQENISIERVINALNSFNIELLRGGILHFITPKGNLEYEESGMRLTENSENIQDMTIIEKIFNHENKFLNIKQEDFKKIIKEISFNITK